MLGLMDAIDVMVRLEQGILHDVFRVLRVAADEEAEAERHLLRLHQQLLHGVVIAGGGPTNQTRALRYALVVLLGGEMRISGFRHSSSTRAIVAVSPIRFV